MKLLDAPFVLLCLLAAGLETASASHVGRVQESARELDHEFDGGSWIPNLSLDEVQIENLTWLGKVWGFLKYHHPRVTSGQLHWDYELFRVLPELLDASDAAQRNEALLSWIERIGLPEPCSPCAQPEENLHLESRVDWIRDAAVLGEDLAAALETVHRNRSTGPQYYVALHPTVGNPRFENELDYRDLGHPDPGFRVLTLFRFWNIIEYWFPYRDLIEEDWDGVLRELIPRFLTAEGPEELALETMALIARVHDTHANLWSSLGFRPPRGDCFLPVAFRFVEGRLVVAAVKDGDPSDEGRLQLGDVVTAMGGTAIEERVEAWRPLYAASNEPTRLRDMALSMARGECGEVQVSIEREGRKRELRLQRGPMENWTGARRDRPGETFQLLTDEVAYLKLSSVRAEDVPGYIERASSTRGLVVDIRNYPSEFVVFALGQLLVSEPTPFTRFTRGDLENPGAFLWTEPLYLTPKAPQYAGRIVILVDEVSQSQAEYTAMALRAAPDAVVVGSTTAGADGNVSPIPLPGSMGSMISGIGVFYPNRSPTQRVGIQPDVFVTPTLEGIRTGRDELIEEALRQILGDEADEAEIRALASRPESR